MTLANPFRFSRVLSSVSRRTRQILPVLVAGPFLLSAFLGGCRGPGSFGLELEWSGVPDRPWPGPDLWANRTQDWEVREGRLWARQSLPMRTAGLLTARVMPERGDVTLTLRMGLAPGTSDPAQEGGAPADLSAGGILLGAGGPDLDFRRAALIHHSPGPGGGIFVGVDEGGHVFVADFSMDAETLARSEESLPETGSLELRVDVTGEAEGARIAVRATPLEDSGDGVSLELPGVPIQTVTGGMSLVSHSPGPDGPRAWFSRIRADGGGVVLFPDRSLGPILGAQHTLSRGTLKLTAQLLPVSSVAPGPAIETNDSVFLEIREGAEEWVPLAAAPVLVPGYTATFRVEDWGGEVSTPYRLVFRPSHGRAPEGEPFQGTVRAEPRDQEEVVVAAFTGNHNVASPGVDRGAFDWETDLWFPHEDIVEHVLAHSPDFLFFSGDQVYEGASPTRADFENPYRDYLYKWYLWLWAFRDLTRDIPAVTIPDDHDVFHGNVWGAGGRTTPPGLTGAAAQDQGGYRLPPDWVNMVQRTQTSHFPPPWDPTPSDQGIENYFTDILYGGVSFAVVEDRKFKSPPKLLLPEADVWNGWAQNPGFDAPTQGDPPGASLLGTRQEEFLEEWASDWAGHTWMKVVLSQTIFANVATIPGDASSGSVIPSLPIPEPGVYVEGDKMAADMDSNGWPHSGRNRAVRAMRKGFAVHLAGDQHLASTLQYGVDAWGDASFALCVPSVANFWPRRWYPSTPGGNRAPGAPDYTGDFRDGLGNLITVFAVSNPARWGKEPAALHERAPGYGIARFNRSTREVSLEAWPRWANPEAGDPPYPGWPVRFRQKEGYGAEPWGYLPALVVEGMENPVVQVVSELGGEVLYTIRIQGTRFVPRVFQAGSYSIRIGEEGVPGLRILRGVQASREMGRTLEVRFQD